MVNLMAGLPYMVNLMAGLETSMREALVPFHSAATPSCTQIFPDGEHYLGEGGDSVDGARTFWCMYGIEGDFA